MKGKTGFVSPNFTQQTIGPVSQFNFITVLILEVTATLHLAGPLQNQDTGLGFLIIIID